MLQQTRVDTVERYYSDFVARFPDVATMAAADESDVLAAWSGLGYYRRARLLLAGARHVAEVHGAKVPDDPDALRAIPGVGPYTAGAIASIAFDRPVPLVDGNVARVLSRIDGVADPKQQGATARRHWGRVAEILAHGRPRVLAQALMELGATVCTPRAPTCLACPVRRLCRAQRDSTQAQIPAPREKKASPVEQLVALAVTWRGKRLFVRRPDAGLLAGLWCLPLLAAPVSAGALAEMLAPAPELERSPAGHVRHVFTHRVWELDVVRAAARRKPKLMGVPASAQTWLPIGQVPDGGIPTLTRRLLASAQALAQATV
jgi:A/G-specific adenine glycosylase